MISFFKKICLLLGSICTLLGCQPNEQADKVILWDVIKALHQQKANLHNTNQEYLYQISYRNTLQQHNTYRQWEALELSVQAQLCTLDAVANSVCQGGTKPADLQFFTQFMKPNTPRLKVKPLIALLRPVLQFEDSLAKKYSQLLTQQVKTKQNLVLFNAKGNDISWIVAYADLVQWKVALLQTQQRIMTHQAKNIAFVLKYTQTPQYYLEALTKSEAVIEGEEYPIEMFLSKTSTSNRNLRVQVNGKPVPTYKDKSRVHFRPTKPGTYTWQGRLTYKYRGRDTTFTIKRQYRVVPK
ncbi:hypothetical protein [Microscilla marina]|uniref:Lipoprotein, putative n=1 Tax=Microscilla marina ATCC 23134 TaxID=313606 RepID=A1ZV11_MICM2|nr:hypothetical protein [Microscilla marina]EAY25789.1 lipoprotein, putative [Microscilla marina ATCC 23134]